MTKEYLTVGELSKKMNVTVRTLQYYDKEGLLKPSALSEGGRRLYSSKDIIKLHQILSFKYLGFTLEDIKEKILKIENPEEVILMLDQQEEMVKEQIKILQSALSSLTILKEEIRVMSVVDFDKYADIITLLRMNNTNYGIIKTLDNSILDHLRERFKDNKEAGEEVINLYDKIVDECIELKNQGIPPSSKEACDLAKKWWDMIMEFTGGDMSLLPKLMEFNDKKENWSEEMAKKQKEIDDYIGKALELYLSELGVNLNEKGQ